MLLLVLPQDSCLLVSLLLLNETNGYSVPALGLINALTVLT